jgi:hypothetical protein
MEEEKEEEEEEEEEDQNLANVLDEQFEMFLGARKEYLGY